MKKFLVTQESRHLDFYEVEAESPEEAIAAVLNGSGNLVNTDFIEVIRDTERVEEID